MPVHRHLHDKLGSVFAYRSELDAWWGSRRARLTQTEAAEAALSPGGPSSIHEGSPASRGLPWLSLVAAAILVGGAFAWFTAVRDSAGSNPLADAKFTRLVEFTGTEQAAAISPDGKFIAFLADQGGQIDAWVSQVGSGTYRNLTHGVVRELVNPSIRTLGFSADSSLVAIWTRHADGSQPGDVKILAAPVTGGPLRAYLPEAAEFDWSSDGKQLVYHTTAPGDPLYVREQGVGSGRGDRRIYVAPTGVHCHFPVWSADKTFIYFVRGTPPDNWDIWRIRPSGAGLERITAHNSRITYPVILDRRTLAYLATDANGSGPWMYAVDVERRVPRRISSGVESYTSLAASADGKRLVATTANLQTSVWRLSIQQDALQAAGEPSLVTANAATPRLGTDFLLYASWRGSNQVLLSLTHGIAREIWSSATGRIIGGPVVARDARHIAFAVKEGDRTLLCVIDADGSHPKTLGSVLAVRGAPTWAPDGQSVVFAVVRDGEPRLTRIFLNGAPPLSLVSEYSVDPVWSPDGRFLVYSGADVGTTFPLRAAAADGRPFPLPSVMLTRGARRVAFFRDAQTLMMLGGEIRHKNLRLLDLRTGTQRELAALPLDFDVSDFDVAADGSQVVFERSQLNSDLAVIERAH